MNRTVAARSFAVALCASLAACVHFPDYPRLVQPVDSGAILIRDARVFTATSREALEHQDVIVEGGLIRSVGSHEENRAFQGLVIDGAGKTLLPGLVDMHVHTTMSSAPPWYRAIPDRQHNLEAHLYAGTTTVLDLGGSMDEVLDERLRIARGEWAGPRVFFAGPILTKPDGYPVSMIKRAYGSLAYFATKGKVVTPSDQIDELREMVRERWARGASVIKIVVADIPRGAPRFTEAEIRAIVEQAAQLGLRVAAHIDTAADAELATRAGVKLLAHGVETSALTPEQAKALAASGASMDTTMVNYLRFDQIAQSRFAPIPLVAQSEFPAMLASFSPDEVKAHPLAPEFYAYGDELEAHEADRGKNAKLLFDAGMPLFAGTDAMGSVGSFAGDIHAELKLLADAGIPNVDVLLAATSRAAHFLACDPSFGTIEPGKSADLLLVRGNPLEHIEDTQNIDTVIVRGQPLLRGGVGKELARPESWSK